MKSFDLEWIAAYIALKDNQMTKVVIWIDNEDKSNMYFEKVYGGNYLYYLENVSMVLASFLNRKAREFIKKNAYRTLVKKELIFIIDVRAAEWTLEYRGSGSLIARQKI